MTRILQLALTVGPAGVSLAEAATLAGLAAESGVTSIRLTDRGALDPSVVAAYLAGVHSGISYLPEVPTTHNAPYNVARRILSLDRATGGRAGVVLRAGAGDEVSDAVIPDPYATDPAQRWSEYARVLTRLWESFPRNALLGDQEAGLVVADALIKAIDHEGAFYRVAGPLDGPSSVQGRPVVVADLGLLGAGAVAESADVVVVDAATGADGALATALNNAGRARTDAVLLGRVTGGSAGEFHTWAQRHRLDGFELAPAGGPGDIAAVLREWAQPPVTAPTLRAALGLGEVVPV